MWRARLVAVGLWAGAIVALLASILFIFAVTAYAAPVATAHEPSPKEAYEARWDWSVRYCAMRVGQYMHERVVYQVSVYGTVPRYTTDRQERLLIACLDALEVR